MKRLAYWLLDIQAPEEDGDHPTNSPLKPTGDSGELAGSGQGQGLSTHLSLASLVTTTLRQGHETNGETAQTDVEASLPQSTGSREEESCREKTAVVTADLAPFANVDVSPANSRASRDSSTEEKDTSFTEATTSAVLRVLAQLLFVDHGTEKADDKRQQRRRRGPHASAPSSSSASDSLSLDAAESLLRWASTGSDWSAVSSASSSFFADASDSSSSCRSETNSSTDTAFSVEEDANNNMRAALHHHHHHYYRSQVVRPRGTTRAHAVSALSRKTTFLSGDGATAAAVLSISTPATTTQPSVNREEGEGHLLIVDSGRAPSSPSPQQQQGKGSIGRRRWYRADADDEHRVGLSMSSFHSNDCNSSGGGGVPVRRPFSGKTNHENTVENYDNNRDDRTELLRAASLLGGGQASFVSIQLELMSAVESRDRPPLDGKSTNKDGTETEQARQEMLVRYLDTLEAAPPEVELLSTSVRLPSLALPHPGASTDRDQDDVLRRYDNSSRPAPSHFTATADLAITMTAMELTAPTAEKKVEVRGQRESAVNDDIAHYLPRASTNHDGEDGERNKDEQPHHHSQPQQQQHQQEKRRSDATPSPPHALKGTSCHLVTVTPLSEAVAEQEDAEQTIEVGLRLARCPFGESHILTPEIEDDQGNVHGRESKGREVAGEEKEDVKAAAAIGFGDVDANFTISSSRRRRGPSPPCHHPCAQQQPPAFILEAFTDRSLPSTPPTAAALPPHFLLLETDVSVPGRGINQNADSSRNHRTDPAVNLLTGTEFDSVVFTDDSSFMSPLLMSSADFAPYSIHHNHNQHSGQEAPDSLPLPQPMRREQRALAKEEAEQIKSRFNAAMHAH